MLWNPKQKRKGEHLCKQREHGFMNALFLRSKMRVLSACCSLKVDGRSMFLTLEGQDWVLEERNSFEKRFHTDGALGRLPFLPDRPTASFRR